MNCSHRREFYPATGFHPSPRVYLSSRFESFCRIDGFFFCVVIKGRRSIDWINQRCEIELDDVNEMKERRLDSGPRRRKFRSIERNRNHRWGKWSSTPIQRDRDGAGPDPSCILQWRQLVTPFSIKVMAITRRLSCPVKRAKRLQFEENGRRCVVARTTHQSQRGVNERDCNVLCLSTGWTAMEATAYWQVRRQVTKARGPGRADARLRLRATSSVCIRNCNSSKSATFVTPSTSRVCKSTKCCNKAAVRSWCKLMSSHSVK